MTIREFINENGMSQSEFAKKLGLSKQAIHSWLCGFSSPKPSIAQKIVEITDGKVSLKDIYIDLYYDSSR